MPGTGVALLGGVKAIPLTLVLLSLLAVAACGGEKESGSSDEEVEATPTPEPTQTPEPASTPAPTPTPPVMANCTVTHMTAGEESFFRVQRAEGDTTSDCATCPGMADKVMFKYAGTDFEQTLEFDGALTNSDGADDDELLLEDDGTVCWSDQYDPDEGTTTATAMKADGTAAILGFVFGPAEEAGLTGKLSYYRNGTLVFEIDVTEGTNNVPYDNDVLLQ